MDLPCLNRVLPTYLPGKNRKLGCMFAIAMDFNKTSHIYLFSKINGALRFFCLAKKSDKNHGIGKRGPFDINTWACVMFIEMSASHVS